MVKKSVQAGLCARQRCPLFGMLCFLCAFVTSLFGTKTASADAPIAALKKTTPIAAPAAVLGMSNPYLIAAAASPLVDAATPQVLRFRLSRDLLDLVHRVERLAVDGVELNQRKLSQPEKLNLRVQSRLGGGVLQLCYRR